MLAALVSTTCEAGDSKMYLQSASLMGTKWHIALYSHDTATANVAFRRAWDVLKEIDRDLSNYSAESELSLLCSSAPHASPMPAGKHLWRVLVAADELSRETDGAFDVTIGPVSKLWRHARKRKTLPSARRLETARSLVGFQFIELDKQSQRVRLTRRGMQIDLGGIAKGYAVDQAVEAIRSTGIASMLVNGGGDLFVGAAPPDQSGWEVDVARLNPAQPPLKTKLTNAAIATSGDAWQYVEVDGKRYSHIIDPRTGVGTMQRKSVSVLASTCMEADGLASAICVLDHIAGKALLKGRSGVEFLQIVVGSNGKPSVDRSERFPRE